MEITGAIALVTGGGSGMGAQTARQLAKQGAQVVVFDVNEEAAKQIAKEINGFGFKCDVSDNNNIENAYALVKEQCGIPRICINCAGIGVAARVIGKEGPMRPGLFEKSIQINLVGTFNMLRLVASDIATLQAVNSDGERGIIINTASIAAFEGQVGQVGYSASKGGITSMTLPLAREMARFGIRVVTIAPGLIDTPMMSALPESVKASLIDSTIFPKRLGRPEEFAKLVLHIIDNVLINGEVIRLDGAIRLQ